MLMPHTSVSRVSANRPQPRGRELRAFIADMPARNTVPYRPAIIGCIVAMRLCIKGVTKIKIATTISIKMPCLLLPATSRIAATRTPVANTAAPAGK